MATYSGKVIEWEAAINSKLSVMQRIIPSMPNRPPTGCGRLVCARRARKTVVI